MSKVLKQKTRVRTNTVKESVCSVEVEPVKFATLWDSYPGGHPYVDPRTGKVPAGYENQCAIKVSIAIHGVGVEMRSFRGAAVKVNGLTTAIGAAQMADWLKLQPFCGLPMWPEKVTGADWQDKIRGKTGIIYFADYWARRGESADRPTGDHIDLWNGSRLTASGMSFFSTFGRRLGIATARLPGTDWSYSDLGRSSEILFWEIK